eukprot:CAMPEP_0202339364 /NCGR_PEP_ID=MMETSP1126-20121109/1259_1 /ASSEMBLY_ACC=CAM_ASM_000457 /TAXON_ID=3047 /ORGANISM="Dunaliella tertiolecta, Strain CCMP1320" /LENGTH=142 /DNA_ID=CAMNT_0048929907 /DNA_START=1049 /DNA_END=1473 /DNA_ORIENTATION=-
MPPRGKQGSTGRGRGARGHPARKYRCPDQPSKKAQVPRSDEEQHKPSKDLQMSEAVVVGSQSGGSLHALAAHAADQLQLEQNQQQESEVTHAAKRPLRVAAPKPGAHEGFDGEPYYDGHSEDEYREKDAERGALVLPAIQGG